MLAEITAALKDRNDIQAWSVRHVQTRGAQLYTVQARVEARRSVSNEYYPVDVLRQTPGADGASTFGSGNITLLPGDEIRPALDAAVLMAGLVHNQPHTIPAPAPLPEVPLADVELQANPAVVLDTVFAQIQSAVAVQPRVHLAAAEFFGEERTMHFVNSRGIEAIQVATEIQVEWVLVSHKAEREIESFATLTRRRGVDLDLQANVARYAQYAVDLLDATSPPDYTGVVVLRGDTLATFLHGGAILSPGPLQMLSSGASKYNQMTPWEIGQTVFRREVTGDPFTLWANRQLPYGTRSDRFDDEGLPAQRVPLIRDNQLVAFTASQRYADYLSIPPTGAFGNVEVAGGKTPAAELLAEPHVEIIAFSWFDPDLLTGDFACEIRLGYVVNGVQRTPFKGGLLIGNMFDALADARWSSESGFFGDYLGPTTARFNHLTISGEQKG